MLLGLILTCAFSAVVFTEQGRSCPRCSYEEDLVCVLDKNNKAPPKTYLNQCLAQTTNCDSNFEINYQVEHKGKCTEEDCFIVCPTIFQPVCASSRGTLTKQFPNKCAVDVTNCLWTDKTTWTVFSNRSCEPQPCRKSCDTKYDAVCARDSQTNTNISFINDCTFRKANCEEKDKYEFISYGACESPKLCPRCALTCNQKICASNGTEKTFMNGCTLIGTNYCSDRPSSEPIYIKIYDGGCKSQSCLDCCPKNYRNSKICVGNGECNETLSSLCELDCYNKYSLADGEEKYKVLYRSPCKNYPSRPTN